MGLSDPTVPWGETLFADSGPIVFQRGSTDQTAAIRYDDWQEYAPQLPSHNPDALSWLMRGQAPDCAPPRRAPRSKPARRPARAQVWTTALRSFGGR